MAEPTINELIQIMINTTLNQQPTPELVTIHKTYTGNYVDIKTDTDDIIEYQPCIGTPHKGDTAILIPLKRNKYAVITK